MMAPGCKPNLRAIDGGLAKVPPAPKTLGPEAREEWRRAAQDLVDRKVLAKSDLPALEAYAVAYAMMRKLQPIAAKSDPVIINEKTGAVKKNPAHVMLTNYLNICLRYQGELGLTPASRNRRAVSAPTAGDEWDQYDL